MSARWFDADEQLLEELGQALAADAPPSEQVDLLMAGYDIVLTDSLEAALTLDTADEAGTPVAVRSDTASIRMMVFEADGITFEFEIGGGRIVGNIDPVQAGVVYLEQPTIAGVELEQATPDDLGAFEFALRASTGFRLRFLDESGRLVVTGWIDGPHQTLT